MKKHLVALLVTLIAATVSVAVWFQLKDDKEGAKEEAVLQKGELLTKMETQGVPSFELPNVSGDRFALKEVAGKLILINFWASWCDPCVREFPSMLKLVEHFGGDLVLVAISNDENEEDMRNFISAFGANIPNTYFLWDKDRSVASSYGTDKLPETFLIRPDLKLLRKILGIEKWYTPGSIRYINELLVEYGVR